MSKTISVRSILSVAVVALIAAVVMPALSVSASDGGTGFGEDRERPRHRPGVPVEVVSVGEDVIEVTLAAVPGKIADEHDIQAGAEITVNVSEETVYKLDGGEGSLTDLEAGEKIYVIGRIDFETLSVDARLITDKQKKPFRVGEVVEVDTDANTILVTGPNLEEGEYILITYDDETQVNQDGEAADEGAISVGDKIHVRGEVNLESEDYKVEISADGIQLWEETMPKPHPNHFRGGMHNEA